jgi:hypothetical protein
MTEKNESFIRYVVVTSHGFWGRSSNLLEALENARVKSFYNLNTKKDDTHKAYVYRIELDPVESRWTDETKAELKRCRTTLRGYEVGDLIEPWVNDWGAVTSWGAKGDEPELVIELKIK